MEKKTLWMVPRQNGKFQPKLGDEDYGSVQTTEKACLELLKEAESYGVGILLKGL